MFDAFYETLLSSFVYLQNGKKMRKRVRRKRGIEWSLRASASMRALYLFLRARAFDKFFSRAASTLESRKPVAPMKYDKE